jgi:hypothetical protein
MIGMTAIRVKRKIQRNRSQIMVPNGVILQSEEYYSDEMPKCLTGRNV